MAGAGAAVQPLVLLTVLLVPVLLPRRILYPPDDGAIGRRIRMGMVAAAALAHSHSSPKPTRSLPGAGLPAPRCAARPSSDSVTMAGASLTPRRPRRTAREPAPIPQRDRALAPHRAVSTGLDADMPGDGVHRVVVVGGGFGGLQAVQKLRRAPVEVTLVDRRNFHLFQPLTYQVATGALSPGEIAYPLRAIFKRYAQRARDAGRGRGLRSRRARAAVCARRPACRRPTSLPYDTLIVAGGSRYSYFGHDEWSEYAAEVKSLESALIVRGRILAAFEAAEAEPDPERRAAWLTFVVVGAGPTGVEMAGQIARAGPGHARAATSARSTRARARILLVEAADRLLTTLPAVAVGEGRALAASGSGSRRC